jgi:hypothetical protein
VTQVAVDAFGNALGDSLAAANGQSSGSSGGQGDNELDALFRQNNNWAGVSASPTFAEDRAMRDLARNPRGLPTSSAASDSGGLYARNGMDVMDDTTDASGRRAVVVRQGQGPLAAFGLAGMSPAEARAMYGQSLATGQIQRNAVGVPMVQPGQTLYVDLNDMSQAGYGGNAIGVESSNRAAIAEAQMRHAAQAATYRNENYGNEGRFSTPSVSSTYDDTSWLSSRGRPMVEQPVYDTMSGLPTGMTEMVPASNRAEMSYGDQMAHVGQVGVGALKGLVNGVPKMVMGAVDLLWQSAAYQGATEIGLDTAQSLAAARQSTAGWTDGTVLPYANREQQLGGVGGELVSPMVYGKGLQLAGAALTAVEGGSTIATPGTNLRAIAAGVQELNPAQAAVLGQLEGFGSRVIIPKSSFGQTDLAALSAATGDEFAMFTAGGRRLIARGDAQGIPIGTADGSAQALAAQGWRWSSHVHPDGVLRSSSGDRAVLGVFSNSRSAVLDPYGGRGLFSSTGDMIGPSWLPSKPPLR